MYDYPVDETTRQALLASQLLDYFDSLAPSHQKEYLKWVNEAKKDEIKQKRITKMIEMLKAKQ